MLKRVLVLLLPLALLGSGCFAQLDAGVKGSGAIAASQTSHGIFDVNVAQSGNVLMGGFKYAEYSLDRTAARPLHVIYSQRLVSLQVNGNFARVQAIGYWNNMPSELMIEVRDSGPVGVRPDWFRIVARPTGMLPVIYDRAGDLIKGDLVVFGATPVPGYTTGVGAIQVGPNTGVFRFKAAHTNSGVVGQAHYSDVSPVATPVSRPRVTIYLPRVTWLRIEGNSAKFGGKGTMNGRSAYIEIKAVDNAQPGTVPAPVPDEFYISAIPVTSDSITPGYSAGGPLIKGDIVVAPL